MNDVHVCSNLEYIALALKCMFVNKITQNYRRYFYGDHNKKIENWSLDEGYQSKEKAFPLRSLNIQKKLGIALDIRQIRKLNHDCWWKDLYVSPSYRYMFCSF